MKILTIKRVSSTAYGTFGVIMYKDVPFAVTLEREWLDNKTGISCIPAGHYTCQRIQSPHFGDTFEVRDVAGRSHILFHKGNIDDDSHGCLLLGERFETLDGTPAILSSKHGFNEYKRILEGDGFHQLRIINCFQVDKVV